jgi:hypothetical protein
VTLNPVPETLVKLPPNQVGGAPPIAEALD